MPVALFLRNNKLQFPSFPFDWLTHANFETRVNLLMTNFSDFLNKDDIIPLEKSGEDVDKKCDYYQNRKNGFYYYHDFPADSDFNTSFPIVKEKYQRRINRLYQKIESANKILFVWFSRSIYLTDNELILTVENLSQKFLSKEIHLLILENKKELSCIKQTKISNKISRFSYDMFSSDNSSALSKVMGNKVLGNQIFSNYKLRLSIRFKIKVFFVNCLPIKKLRRKIRERVYNKC